MPDSPLGLDSTSGVAGDRELVAIVRRSFSEHVDPQRAVAQQRYMKSALPYYGLSRPVMKSCLRPILGDRELQPKTPEAWESMILELWDRAAFREERYAAISLARHRLARDWRDASRLPLWRHLIVTGAWWDLVDEIAGHLVGPALRAESERVRPVMWEWARGQDLWLRRTAILANLGAREQADLGLLTHAIEQNLEPRLAGTPFEREFFLRKAIGWALRDYAYTDPGWVRTFLAAHEDQLSGLSLREARKHL